MLFHQFRFAVRSLFKNKFFTLLNVLGLTIGIASAILLFIWVQNEWTFDQYHRQAKQLYRATLHWQGGNDLVNIGALPLALCEEAPKKIPAIEGLYSLRPAFGRPLIHVDNQKIFEVNDLAYISDNWFEGFDYEILEGDVQTFQDLPNRIALTKDRALQFFGTSNAIGKTLTIDSTIYSVHLILENNPANSSLHYTLLLPQLALWPTNSTYEQHYRAGNYNFFSFVKFSNPSDATMIEEQLGYLLTELEGGEDPKSCRLTPLPQIRFVKGLPDDYIPHQSKSVVSIFAVIGLLLLATAMANYINLSTALFGRKAKNLEINRIIGANFRTIFRQVILETFLINVSALIFAVVVVHFTLPWLANFVDIPLSFDVTNFSLWLALVTIAVGGTIISGFYPAFITSKYIQPNSTPVEQLSKSGRGLRYGLVTAQFVITIVVFISAGVIYQQLHYIYQKDVGYERSEVININPHLFRGDIRSNIDRFLKFGEELKRLPGISAITVAEAPLTEITNHNRGGFSWEGMPADYQPFVAQLAADAYLPQVFDLEMAAGRWFSKDLSDDLNHVIVNEAAINNLGIEEPVLGKRISYRRSTGQIIGIVKNFHFANFHEAIEPLIIWNNNGRAARILAKIEGQDMQRIISEASTLFETMVPGVVFNYEYLDESFKSLHLSDQKMGTLMLIFAIILIVIASLGLFGLAVFTAERRIKEISIRKILGATIPQIVGMLTGQLLKPLVGAILIAIPIGYYLMNRWLQEFAYHIEMPWWVFLIAIVATVGIVMVVVGSQTIKTAQIDPVHSLRKE